MKDQLQDKVTITCKFKREENGLVSHSFDIDGEGFMIFELVGLLEILKSNLVRDSRENAKKINESLGEGKKVRIKYDKNTNSEQP